MFSHGYRIWRLDYLFVSRRYWEREWSASPWRQNHEVLDLCHARWALDEIAREPAGMRLLREIAKDVLPFISFRDAVPRSYETAQESRRLLEALKERALGSIFSEHGKPPHFAWVYVCRRKRVPLPVEPVPDPWQDVRNAIETAKLAPRGFVCVKAVTAAGAPVPALPLQVILSDGDVVKRSTNEQGELLLEGIPQGRCTIRVLALDGGAWAPVGGEPSTRIERGYKRLHVVTRGENLSHIAQRHGIKGWRKLWEAPDNENLRKKRRSPHVLHPGDEVVVPAIDIHEIMRPTDQTHTIVVSQEKVEFRVILQDHNQLPFANETYELYVGDRTAAPRRGTTDSSGKVQEQVSSWVQKVEVRLPELGIRWTFLLSDFVERPTQEAETRNGEPNLVQQAVRATQLRLNALGLPCGSANGNMGPKTQEALALYERTRSIPTDQPTGEYALGALDQLEPLFTWTA